MMASIMDKEGIPTKKVIYCDNDRYEVNVKYVGRENSDNVFKVFGNPLRQRIIRCLVDKGGGDIDYLSKELNIKTSTLHYHIRLLEKAGLIRSDLEKRRGLYKKYYFFNADAILVDFCGFHKRKLSLKRGIIVVGSPDPHGEFKLRARDGYLSGFLGNYLGLQGWKVRIIEDINFSLHNHDSEEVIFVIGGPLTNNLSYSLNDTLKVKHNPKYSFRSLYSSFTGVDYMEENISMISKIKRDHIYVILSGITLSSTFTSICALKDLWENILIYSDEAYYIVEGIDKDNDGMMESYNVIEKHLL